MALTEFLPQAASVQLEMIRDWLTDVVQAQQYQILLIHPAMQMTSVIGQAPAAAAWNLDWQQIAGLSACFEKSGSHCLLVREREAISSIAAVLPGKLAQQLGETGVAMVAQMPVRGATAGMILIGGKVSGEAYTEDELRGVAGLGQRFGHCVEEAMAVQDREYFGGMSRGLAHDLKNHLTSVTLCLQLLPVDREKALELLPLAVRNLESVKEYVQQARWFSERRLPRFQIFEFGALVRRAIAAMADRIQAGGVRIGYQSDAEAAMEGDPVLIARMMVNFVANALEASAPGAEINLAWRLVPLGDEKWLQVKVNDPGTGIQLKRLQAILVPDYPGGNPGAPGDSVGLGLSICHRIIELHHGRLTVSSSEAGGTQVQIDLPVEQKH